MAEQILRDAQRRVAEAVEAVARALAVEPKVQEDVAQKDSVDKLSPLAAKPVAIEINQEMPAGTGPETTEAPLIELPPLQLEAQGPPYYGQENEDLEQDIASETIPLANGLALGVEEIVVDDEASIEDTIMLDLAELTDEDEMADMFTLWEQAAEESMAEAVVAPGQPDMPQMLAEYFADAEAVDTEAAQLIFDEIVQLVQGYAEQDNTSDEVVMPEESLAELCEQLFTHLGLEYDAETIQGLVRALIETRNDKAELTLDGEKPVDEGTHERKFDDIVVAALLAQLAKQQTSPLAKLGRLALQSKAAFMTAYQVAY